MDDVFNHQSFLPHDAVVVSENTQTGCRIVEQASRGRIWKVYELAVVRNRKRYKNTPGTGMSVCTMHDEVLRELSILQILDHRNCLHLLHHYETSEYIALEFERGTPIMTLHGPFSYTANVIPSAGLCLQLARDLLAGVGYIHSLGIVHRDVKPDNVFFMGDRFVLADFGSARRNVPSDGMVRESPATLAFYPPELCGDLEEGVCYDAFKADLWAVGLTLWIFRFGVLHVAPEEDDLSITSLIEGIREFKINTNTRVRDEPDPRIRKCIRNLLNEDPNKRMCTLEEENNTSSSCS